MKISLKITPEEIRSIRKQLGLSQVEAGELIGGGPRAFTKYEAGTVRPAASLIRLLHVLQTDPAALATLRGDKTGSITSGVTSPFDVTGPDILIITEKNFFPQLLRRLLHAEALANNLPADGIHVASNVSAPDGGEDGRITWKDGPSRTPFLPSRLCQFQLKAGKIGPTAAAKDVLTKNLTVKVMVSKVLEANGNYIMLCARPYTQKQIKDRKASIQKALRRAGMAIEDGQVDFRDADQIAAWVNCHATVAMWVKEQTPSRTIRPFQSWSQWAGRSEHEESPWVEDERLPGLRAYLHKRIKEPRSFVRILGPAGVGKSRLTLKALGSAVEDCAEDRFLSDIVLYADQSEASGMEIIRVVQDLAVQGQRAVVVVDRCEPRTHRILARIVSRQSSRLSLVTIDNEIPTGTLGDDIFKVDEAPSSVTETIIKHISPGLPSEDERRLVAFSKGFPKMAVLIGQAWTRVPIANATKDDLVETFVIGRRSYGRRLLLQSAALIAVFGLIEAESVEGELGEIARLGNSIDPEDMYAAVSTLVERGAARRRGRFVALQPRPISLRLAERQWKEWDRTKWDQVLASEISPRLKVLAARQLALLNTTKISKKVVIRVCRPGGPFEGFESLSKAGNAETLSALAEINPEVVAGLIERSLDNAKDLSRVTAEVRRHILYALAKVCFHPNTFEEGARLLLRLASAEDEQWANSATGQFVGLFPVLLGETAADGNARLSVLDEAISGNTENQRVLAVRGLLAGSKTRDFTRLIGGAEIQGTRPAMEPWRPATEKEMVDYIERCVSLLAGLAVKDDKVGVTARKGLGQNLRPLILTGLIDLVETVVVQVGAAVSYWPEAIKSLRDVLFFDTKDIDDDITNRVNRLFTDLEPKSLQLRIRVHVTEGSRIYLRDKDSDHENRIRARVKAVSELAKELLEQPAALSRALPELSKGKHRMAGELGVALAELADSPLKWLKRIKQAVLQTSEDERNFNLLTGFVKGLAKDHPEIVAKFKESASRSPDLAPSLLQTCSRLGITASDIKLVTDALQADLLPPWRLNEWSFGGVLTEVHASAVAPLFDAMLGHSAEGFKVAINLMGMYAYPQTEKLEGLRPQIRNLVENLAKWQESQIRDLDVHHFEKIVGWMLGKGRQDPEATATALALSKTLIDSTQFGGDRFTKPLLSKLLSDFPEVTWQIIGQAIVTDKRKAALLTSVLGDRFSREANPLILSLPENALFAWFHAHPDRAPAFAARILPVLESYKVETSNPSLHPVTKRLLDEFGEREDVQRAVKLNIYNGCSGSVTTYYALHKEPFSKLLQHPKPEVRIWAKVLLRNIDTEIERARKRDEELEALLEY